MRVDRGSKRWVQVATLNPGVFGVNIFESYTKPVFDSIVFYFCHAYNKCGIHYHENTDYYKRNR
ncbi:MAG: hypothetical protein HW406_827 [Candidatus Brocadiaceae bacterium]|nr:hypothetical protein [Candidatus Brocadiaceae bacterium]